MQGMKNRLERDGKKSILCLGIDPVEKNLQRYFELLESAAPHVCTVKFNYAFFSDGRFDGLKSLIAHAKELGYFTILDGKRADIGNTNRHYLKELEYFGADACTLNPYMGLDSFEGFENAYLLCRATNPGSEKIQKLKIGSNNGKYLYEHVAGMAKEKGFGLVVGALDSEALRKTVKLGVPLLIPGIGAQGGAVKEVMSCLGSGVRGSGVLQHRLNVSRAIIYAKGEKTTIDDSLEAIKKMNKKIKVAL
ncbi:orotidine-5'-phosphate decarboxylase [Candidatus Micrarchaeota archaeon CG_4_10_14_0_2_um_filter_49_7]|nr:MAG: orotidine-5'-phosphate decarboxylase [Candidatus Micrarchaeota archaeon CG06_land_8_20_14_3_00_50_6]PIZ99895.1 MAG: orotidine-5'-phosphate decarboxylase [Candidatus Micrarchaeota archaeon CG_4_10_14_0_2_um_filter_49_7]